MSVSRVVAGIILAGAFVWTDPASAGWVIEEVVKGSGEGSREQILLQANRMKTVTFEGGKPTAASILDLNAQTITRVDYREKHYFAAPIQEYVRTMQEVMAGAMKAMQEAAKGMSPEERKMMQQMVPGAGPQQCREPRIEMRKTSQQATIAGYPAVRYDVLADGELVSEVWIARGIPAWRELDSKKLERFGVEMAKLAGCGPGQGQQGPLGDYSSWKLANEGYPVRTVVKSGGGETAVEVVKAESRTIPASEFQPPAGFARKTFQQVMGQ